MKLSNIILLAAIANADDGTETTGDIGDLIGNIGDTVGDFVSDWINNWKDKMGETFDEKFSELEKDEQIQKTKDWFKDLGENMKNNWDQNGEQMVADMKESMDKAWDNMKGVTVGEMFESMEDAQVSFETKMETMKEKINALNLEQIINKLEDKSEKIDEIVTAFIDNNLATNEEIVAAFEKIEEQNPDTRFRRSAVKKEMTKEGRMTEDEFDQAVQQNSALTSSMTYLMASLPVILYLN